MSTKTKNRIVNYRKGTQTYVAEERVPVDTPAEEDTEPYDIIQTPVTALLHFDDDSNPWKDECGNVWETYGTPTISETNAKFGKAAYFNGSSYVYRYGDWSLGGQDFTIDFWATKLLIKI